MMFDKLCVEKILQGEKTVTRRIKRNSRRPAVPGSIHKLKIDRTPAVYGHIKIISCRVEKNIHYMPYEDYKKEGFNTGYEFMQYWLNVNFPYKGEEIWRVEFELVNGDNNESI